MQRMVITMPEQTGYGSIRHVEVSLPMIGALVDRRKYRMPDDAKRAPDFRRSRGPRGRSTGCWGRIDAAVPVASPAGHRLKCSHHIVVSADRDYLMTIKTITSSISRMGAKTPKPSRADFTVSLLERRFGVMRANLVFRNATAFEPPDYAKSARALQRSAGNDVVVDATLAPIPRLQARRDFP